ncbi:MAG: helix-turn-helix domain-containing protein [Spirochaetota bacterium]
MERGVPSTFYSTFPPDWSAGVLYAGEEHCLPNHSWRGVRDHFLLHYVVEGAGEVRRKRRSYALTRGDAFLFAPGDYLHYRADAADPWHYLWVGFGGVHADDVLAQLRPRSGVPVMAMPYSERVHDGFRTMLAEARERRATTAMRLAGLLYRLIADLTELRTVESVRTTASDLVDEACAFVQQNYQRDIGVADVIGHIGVDRSHFSRVFRAQRGLSLRDYLIRIRMERARRLIRETSLSVQAVASSVGYRSYPSFERRFQAYYECSPTQARRMDGGAR